MSTVTLSVTEFSRGLSNFLNQVQYQGQALDIQRGKRIVARVLPASPIDGFPLDKLDAFLQQGPQLSATERASMVAELAVVRSNLLPPDDAWAS